MTDPNLIADLIRAGVDPDLVGRVANAMLARKSADSPVDSPVDIAAEKRRAYDRERQRNKRTSGGHPPTSAESANVALTTKEDSQKEVKSRAHRLSADWKPSEVDREFACSKGATGAKIEFESEKFRNYWTAKSGRDAAKLDWPATWRNWILSALERSGAPMPTAPPPLNSEPEWKKPPWEREGISEIAWRERELGKTNGAQVRRDS